MPVAGNARRAARPPFCYSCTGLTSDSGNAPAGTGTRTTGMVRCDQPRALDLRAHGGKKLESVPAANLEEVLAKLAPIFE